MKMHDSRFIWNEFTFTLGHISLDSCSHRKWCMFTPGFHFGDFNKKMHRQIFILLHVAVWTRFFVICIYFMFHNQIWSLLSPSRISDRDNHISSKLLNHSLTHFYARLAWKNHWFKPMVFWVFWFWLNTSK
jgi:hypothetical protein